MQNFVISLNGSVPKGMRCWGVMASNSTIRQIEDVITEKQHKDQGIVESVIHMHLDEKNCLEIILMREDTAELKALVEALITR